MVTRCKWATSDPLLMAYHDHEWGVPVDSDQRLFELLSLELFQAGLSWLTVLKKRPAFRLAFENFDVQAVSKFSAEQVAALLGNANIIRNRAKIEATINNAQAIVELTAAGKSLHQLVWERTNGMPLDHLLGAEDDDSVPQAFVKPYVALFKQSGLRRIGPTTCYSFLQAAGVINDHQMDCLRYPEINALAEKRHP